MGNLESYSPEILIQKSSETLGPRALPQFHRVATNPRLASLGSLGRTFGIANCQIWAKKFWPENYELQLAGSELGETISEIVEN